MPLTVSAGLALPFLSMVMLLTVPPETVVVPPYWMRLDMVPPVTLRVPLPGMLMWLAAASAA